MNISKDFSGLIGSTPMVRLNSFSEKEEAELVAKLEFFNPGGSIKDRIAEAMITQAEKKGELTPTTTIVEPTSGNTGIGLAAVSAARGYRLILTMPESMSGERRSLLKALGAELVLTPAEAGMQGAVDKAKQIVEEEPDTFMPQQFTNPANPQIHHRSTGPEIWADTNGKVDIFVAGIGTGGTITGVGKLLKEKNENIQVIGVEPAASAVLAGEEAGPHKIQGIGAGFVPENLEQGIIDEVLQVEDEEAVEMAQKVARKEGLLVGISSGAALAVARQIARRSENTGKLITVIFPDSGERYLSTELFNT